MLLLYKLALNKHANVLMDFSYYKLLLILVLIEVNVLLVYLAIHHVALVKDLMQIVNFKILFFDFLI